MDAIRFEALRLAKGLRPTASNIQRVAAATNSEAASWAFTQCGLRDRAEAKFTRAEQMLFDRDGLEMATHENVARLHAHQFPKGAKVADLTCGIGGDLIALAHENEAVGYEIDPVRAEIAAHNLAVYDRSAELREIDCVTAPWDFEYAFADPSRRNQNKRTLDAEHFQPPLSALAQRMPKLRLGLIKLSPMLPDDLLLRYGRRIDFVSHEGECKEVVLRVGSDLDHPDGNHQSSISALHVESGRRLPGSERSIPSIETPIEFVFEADPAAIRAHALAELCSQGGLELLGDSNGYLTGESLPHDDLCVHFVKAYRVLSFGHADEKAIRGALSKLDGRVDAVKVRGAKEDPILWKKRLKSGGSRPTILALYPVGRSLRYVLVEPAKSPRKNT